MSSVPSGESSSKGKAVASPEPKPEFKCPRCCKVFHSAPALCGHQNAHRLAKDPMNMSPVLAAVLNNPLPPDDKPELITPSQKTAASKEPNSQQQQQPSDGNVSAPRFHPYRRPGKEPMEENNPDKELAEEDAQSEYLPFERILSENEYPLRQCVMTMDLLGEWMPISGFGDHAQSSILRINPMEPGEAAGSKKSPGHLDLELKLGF